jgi:hypothetical protein
MLVLALSGWGQQPKPAPATTKSPEPPKPARKRVVTDLAGFDLLATSKLKTQTMVAGGTRGAPRPVALAPRLGRLYGIRPVFHWTFPGAAQSFVFVLLDDQQSEVLRQDVQGSSFAYPEKAPALQPGRTYFWTVEPATATLAEASAPAGFVVVSPEQRQEIEKSLNATAGDSYQTALARARSYTQHRLWYDAVAEYDLLIRNHPDRAELYEERGTIYAQLPATETLADADFARADQLRQGRD